MKKMLTVIVSVMCAFGNAQAKANSYSKADVFRALRSAALTYDVNYHKLKSIAWCESRFKPDAVNPLAVGSAQEHAKGLMQFLPSTWARTPFSNLNIYNPYASAAAGAWMIRQGRISEFDCA